MILSKPKKKVVAVKQLGDSTNAAKELIAEQEELKQFFSTQKKWCTQTDRVATFTTSHSENHSLLKCSLSLSLSLSLIYFVKPYLGSQGQKSIHMGNSLVKPQSQVLLQELINTLFQTKKTKGKKIFLHSFKSTILHKYLQLIRARTKLGLEIRGWLCCQLHIVALASDSAIQLLSAFFFLSFFDAYSWVRTKLFCLKLVNWI